MAGSVYLPVKDASSVIWPFPQWNSKDRGTGRPLAVAVLGMPYSPTARRGSCDTGVVTPRAAGCPDGGRLPVPGLIASASTRRQRFRTASAAGAGRDPAAACEP